MSFRREKKQDYYLHDTAVENVFINEYMIDAKGEHVKVYLCALMYADSSLEISNEMIARQLLMAEEDVLAAWTYWEEKGVVKKHFPDPKDRLHYSVEILELKERIYGRNGKAKEKKSKKLPEKMAASLNDTALRELYSRIEQITGRMLEGKEPVSLLSFLTDYGFTADAIAYAYEYCVKHRSNCKHNYISAILKEWAERGLLELPAIKAHLAETDSRHYMYKRVLKALGFARNATEEEQRIIDTWFDELQFDLETILAGCKKTSGIANPNINYINTVLRAWKNEGKNGGATVASPETPISKVLKSYEEDRQRNEREAEERRAEIYRIIPRIREIEEEVRAKGLEISRHMLSGGTTAKAAIRDIRKATDRLSQEKAFLLTENNFKINYMDTWYTCPICKDTGTLDTGERCSCFAERLGKKEKRV